MTIENRLSTELFATNGQTGAIVDLSDAPFDKFSIQVSGPVNAWDVRLEGSLDGINFGTILQHTNIKNKSAEIISVAAAAPILYMRSRCAFVDLGNVSNLKVVIMATLPTFRTVLCGKLQDDGTGYVRVTDNGLLLIDTKEHKDAVDMKQAAG